MSENSFEVKSEQNKKEKEKELVLTWDQMHQPWHLVFADNLHTENLVRKDK